MKGLIFIAWQLTALLLAGAAIRWPQIGFLFVIAANVAGFYSAETTVRST